MYILLSQLGLYVEAISELFFLLSAQHRKTAHKVIDSKSKSYPYNKAHLANLGEEVFIMPVILNIIIIPHLPASQLGTFLAREVHTQSQVAAEEEGTSHWLCDRESFTQVSTQTSHG